MFNAGRIRLIDSPRLVAQFAGLERRATVRGDKIDHAPGSYDDASNAAALTLVLAAAPAVERGLCAFGTYGSCTSSNHLGQVGGYSNAEAYRSQGGGARPDSAHYGSSPDEFRRMVSDLSYQQEGK
jgi:hypothetical protein